MMESLYKYIRPFPYKDIDEDKFVQKLENCLNKGGNVDFEFVLDKKKDQYGTVLHFAVMAGCEKIVKFAISRGANIAIGMTNDLQLPYNENAIELAVKECGNNSHPRPEVKDRIYDMIKKRALKLCSRYGLNPFHLDCAFEISMWSDEKVQSLQTADVNMTISANSPIWPGDTPILIAAKFKNKKLAKRLLDLGAVPVIKDLDGNTPLHYLYESIYPGVCDERLFALDGGDTFGLYCGKTHFHIACTFCPGTLHIVKRYLDQGVSPNLRVKEKIDMETWPDVGKTGLHIGAEEECPDLLRLLLENGAEPNKVDSNGYTPIDYICSSEDFDDMSNAADCVCLLIEAGSNQKSIGRTELFSEYLEEYLISDDSNAKKAFLKCIKRLSMLNDNLVSNIFKDIYSSLCNCSAEEDEDGNEWNDGEYADLCTKELKALPSLDFRRIIDGTIILQGDFQRKFGWLDSFDFNSYPVYGSLLKMKFKRKMIEFKKQKIIIQKAIPKVQWLFQKHGHLPNLCADVILWNLSRRELDQFMEK